MKLGDRIKTERERLGLTQEELAHKIGYASRSSVQKIETCRTLPMNKIVAVAKALGVSPSYRNRRLKHRIYAVFRTYCH